MKSIKTSTINAKEFGIAQCCKHKDQTVEHRDEPIIQVESDRNQDPADDVIDQCETSLSKYDICNRGTTASAHLSSHIVDQTHDNLIHTTAEYSNANALNALISNYSASSGESD